MTNNTLKITFGKEQEHRDAARERIARAEAGETGEAIEQEDRMILGFGDFEDVERLMRRSNLALIDAIANDQPESIRAAAEAVDRDYKEVHRNLKELESLGVIEFVQDGVSKRPILRNGTEEVDFSLTFGRRTSGERLTA